MGKKKSVAAHVRAMVLDGKTDSEIWENIRAEFNLDPMKHSYIPSYQRREMIRRIKKNKRCKVAQLPA